MAAEGVYGSPLPALASPGAKASQLSPLIPSAAALEAAADGAFSKLTIVAPPGALERRFVLAHALRALTAGGELIALAPKDKGGLRLRKELAAFGCDVAETAKRHHRVCVVRRPEEPVGLAAAIAEGGAQMAPGLGLWSQPGVFSWDRLDPGTALLLGGLPAYSGRGADLGCGLGVLARAVLGSPQVSELTLVDVDRRAVEAARRNVEDPRARFLHADVRASLADLKNLDFVVMNPPFHEGGAEDRALGQVFIRAAAAMLRKGGTCRMVANIALPYEGVLGQAFAAVTPLGQAHGYKLFEARK
ncbi:MAG TPA: class I SAM-dependent methyltransferase [Caulobacteraceae bacterium]|nr:class I SAM-dependent methyltransferase [Caulobacteraceae bacterium]